MVWAVIRPQLLCYICYERRLVRELEYNVRIIFNVKFIDLFINMMIPIIIITLIPEQQSFMTGLQKSSTLSPFKRNTTGFSRSARNTLSLDATMQKS